jgi:outer membrane protein OmpA-like peptidoglycan-associated protein
MRIPTVAALCAIVFTAGCATKGFVRKEVAGANNEAMKAQAQAAEAHALAENGQSEALRASREAGVARDLALGNVRREEVRKVTVQFAFDSAKLSDEARAELDGVASDVSMNPNYMAIISGFTCSIGPESYNRQLAARRADAVTHYLAEKIGPEFVRLAALGFGEIQPVADNETNDGRELNRRVEVSIVRPVPANEMPAQRTPEDGVPPRTL